MLDSLRESCKGLKHEIIVVSNGSRGVGNGKYAREQGLKVIHLKQADKRAAVAAGAEKARHEITILLDSDTRAMPDSIRILKDSFVADNIGGVTPLQKILNRDRLVRRFGRNLTTLGPLLTGAAVAAFLNRRATVKLAEEVRRDLAKRRRAALPPA